MIRHDFVCARDGCNHIEPDVVIRSDSTRNYPKHCGRRMEISYCALRPHVTEFTPFFTRNIHPDGKLLEVKNRGDLEHYAREYGVRHIDDPDLVAEGNQIVRRQARMPHTFIDMGKR